MLERIILNALGFVSRPLYLFTQFFNDKALSTGQKFERVKKVSFVVFKIKEYMTQVIEAITKNTLCFASMLFNFDWLFLMKPSASATRPTQSDSK